MSFLGYTAALSLVLGAVLARYAVDPVERFYARFLVGAGIAFGIVAALI